MAKPNHAHPHTFLCKKLKFMNTMPKIAVLIPCYNEELTVAQVVSSFRKELPQAPIYVYDNNSQDKTCEIAAQAGAIVKQETRQGKGHVVRRMFNDIEADIYILVDGDATYDATQVHGLINKLTADDLDMVVAIRQAVSNESYRAGHQWGNHLFNWVLSFLFGSQFQDIFSGYRAFSRRFVKGFPCLSGGFEIETEISVHALEMQLPVAEIPTSYGARPEGSNSKLNTYTDGLRILMTIFVLFKSVKPLQFFGSIAAILTVAALGLAIPLISTYLNTGLVPKLPTAVLVASLMIVSCLCFFSGLILDTLSHSRREMKRLFYLASNKS
jgi:glycosyltransferase involved in cell wall biosynthesis